MNELPKGWAKATIADVTLPYGTTDPTRSPAIKFAYIDIGSIDNQTQAISTPKTISGRDAPSRARRIVAAGDILFSTVRTHLKNIAFVPEELHGQLTSTGIAILRPNEAIEGRYLFNFVRSDGFITDISKAQDGTLYPAVTDKDINSAILPLAPLPEQKRIVAKIDALMARTSLARSGLDHILVLVDRYKQLLLKIAFTEGFTGEKQKWQYATVGEVAETQLGKMLDRAKNKGEPTRYLRNINVRWLGFDLGDILEMPMTDQDRARFNIADGDILVCEGGEPGRSAVWKNGLTDLAFQKALIRIRPRRDHLDSHFFTYFMKYAADSGILKQYLTGSTIKHLPQKALQRIKLPLPPYNIQREIIRHIETAFTWLNRLSVSHAAATKLLPKLDAAILAKAFRGELLPQDPDDEPASVLLERIKEFLVEQPRGGRERASRVKAIKEEFMSLGKNIQQVLAEADDWVPAQEAFQRCGIDDGASTEDIERIYAQLRDLDVAGKLEAEAVTDNEGRKIYDRIRLKAV